MFGLEGNAKHHVPEIKSIWPWFKEFYKNHDVLVLKRRNLEGHFISQLFNDCLTKQMPYQLRQTRYEVANNYGIVAEDIMKANILEYKVEFKFDKKLFNNFCNHIRFLEDKVISEIKPQVIYKEDIKAGLSNAPSAFIDLLNGRNFGKLLVKVSDKLLNKTLA